MGRSEALSTLGELRAGDGISFALSKTQELRAGLVFFAERTNCHHVFCFLGEGNFCSHMVPMLFSLLLYELHLLIISKYILPYEFGLMFKRSLPKNL